MICAHVYMCTNTSPLAQQLVQCFYINMYSVYIIKLRSKRGQARRGVGDTIGKKGSRGHDMRNNIISKFLPKMCVKRTPSVISVCCCCFCCCWWCDFIRSGLFVFFCKFCWFVCLFLERSFLWSHVSYFYFLHARTRLFLRRRALRRPDPLVALTELLPQLSSPNPVRGQVSIHHITNVIIILILAVTTILVCNKNSCCNNDSNSCCDNNF